MSRFCLIAALLLVASFTARADTLHVAVASNFQPVLLELVPMFEQAHPHRITVSAAASGVLFQQIINGAPFDIFLSADAVRPQQLEAMHLTQPGTRATYAVGELVLASRVKQLLPTGDDPDALKNFLRSRPPRSIAIADPGIAPYGLAARQLYQHLGIWSAAAASRVTANNVSQVAMLVATGSVDAGFVSRAQQLGSDWHAIALANDGYAPVQQQMVVLKHAPTPAAREFLGFMLGDAARARINARGYRLP